MHFQPKLVAFDLDGTLSESKQRMSAEMGELLGQLLQEMPVAILSGGGWKQFERQFLPSVPEGMTLDRLYLFPTNAAMCLVHRNGTWHPQYDHSFSPEVKDRIIKAIKDSIEEVGFEQPPRLWGEQIEDRGGEVTFSALGQEAPIEEKLSYDPSGKKRTPLAEALRRRLPELSIGINAATSIDITPHGINKAYGINRLIELTGISVKEMLYVGDALEEGGNDAVVIQTGVRTHQVFGPEETRGLIESLLHITPR
ncbi:HAD-IIB family hydrolase [Candidatus Kaiserbacteria bacterium]|nr:HAD-IIB family hydrolase [Candidatus Kaiserbacteria bacterium]